MGRDRQKKPTFEVAVSANPLKAVLDIDEEENDNTVIQSKFLAFSIHTKCYVSYQTASDYFDNYLMKFIKADEEDIIKRKREACEDDFEIVKQELNMYNEQKTFLRGDGGNEVDFSDSDSEYYGNEAFYYDNQRGTSNHPVDDKYTIWKENISRLKDGIIHHHLFDLGFQVIHKEGQPKY